tara:strand:+ start:324 stop:500 length:177 start_codon:yes stop_codon:yes gene_type:complete
LKQGEFITFADGEYKRVQFKLQAIKREIPYPHQHFTTDELKLNFERIYREAKSIFKVN